MTDTERLRRLDRENEELRDMLNQVAWRLGLGDEVHYYADNYLACQLRVLAAIEGLTERESDVETVRSDAMKAWEWVREHGGLDYVRAEWSSRVPYDLYQRRRQRLLDHIAECETALGRRNVRIEKLGKTIEFFQLNNSNFRHLLADVAERLGFTRYGDDYEPEDLLDTIDRRLMPEGVEWPRYGTGEPVRIGGTIADELGRAHEVTSIEFCKGEVALHWNPAEPEECVWVGHGERVRRPVVLASDGEPLEVEQTVYAPRYDYVRCTVLSFEWAVDGWLVEVENEGGCKFRQTPDCFTHQRPVLGADGVPIREGDKVWTIYTGDEFVAKRVAPGNGEMCVFVADYEYRTGFWIDPASLTHTKPEPPDSWERIEEDARLKPLGYVDRVLGWDMRKSHSENQARSAMTHDLVRRCKALAEMECDLVRRCKSMAERCE